MKRMRKSKLSTVLLIEPHGFGRPSSEKAWNRQHVRDQGGKEVNKAKQHFKSMNGNFKLYASAGETFPIPLKHLDVLRRTTSNTDNVFGRTISNVGTDAKEDVLSEDPTRTARFHIL